MDRENDDDGNGDACVTTADGDEDICEIASTMKETKNGTLNLRFCFGNHVDDGEG